MSTFVFTTGGDFDFSGQVSVMENSVLVPDMTGWTGYCAIKTLAGAAVATPAFSWLDAAQRLCRVYLPASGIAWPSGVLELNLLFVGPQGQRVASPVVQFAVTQGAASAPA